MIESLLTMSWKTAFCRFPVPDQYVTENDRRLQTLKLIFRDVISKEGYTVRYWKQNIVKRGCLQLKRGFGMKKNARQCDLDCLIRTLQRGRCPFG